VVEAAMAVVVVDHRIRQATPVHEDRAVVVMALAAALEDMAAEAVVMVLEALVALVAQTAMRTRTTRTQSLVDVGGEGARKRTINVPSGVRSRHIWPSNGNSLMFPWIAEAIKFTLETV
jgi:hypothetical protein